MFGLLFLSVVYFLLWPLPAEIIQSRPPNFVFILADDLDSTLGGMEPLQKTRALLEKNGVTFTNAFVTTPLCCPSRSSILTGRYVHNHGTWNNSISGGCSSLSWQLGPEKNTFATVLKKQNYTTFYAGKYLNQYGMKSVGGTAHIPPGWDWWHGLVGNSVYYNYSLSVNGTEQDYGDNPDSDYLTSVIINFSINFLNNLDPGSRFFMQLSPPCPHAPFTPLPKYAEEFSNRTAPRTPNFNIPGGKGKHWLLRQPPSPLPQSVIDQVDNVFRNRWRTLLSLDDLVENVVNTLQRRNLLNNTYIFFSSDHGFHLGQFSLPWDKRQPYEFDIRVPLVVSGPGVRPGTSIQVPVLNIDLAPTFMELAGADPLQDVDGTSFAHLLRFDGNQTKEKQIQSWRKQFIVEHRGEGSSRPIKGCPQYDQGGVADCTPDCICQDSWNNSYSCLRSLRPGKDALLCHFKDDESFMEEYDLTTDPFQMVNLALVDHNTNGSTN